MTGNRSLVSIVDDDESVRESLPDLLRQFGFAAEAFSSAEAFLASDVVSETSCLLLDIAMPGMSGPDLQQELTRHRQKIPIVFITGLGDSESVRPRLLARGAVECLVKPFSEAALLDAVRAALRRPYSGARDGDMRSLGEARSESMARVISHDTPVVFVVDDDVSVRESLELLILSVTGSPRRSSRRRISSNVAHRRSELPGSRCDASQPQWPRSPETHHRSGRHADHLHHRLWRRADHGAGDEGRCSGVPDQAIRR